MQEYTVGSTGFRVFLCPKTGSHPRNRLAASAAGGASPVSPSWVSRTHPSLPVKRICFFTGNPRAEHLLRSFWNWRFNEKDNSGGAAVPEPAGRLQWRTCAAAGSGTAGQQPRHCLRPSGRPPGQRGTGGISGGKSWLHPPYAGGVDVQDAAGRPDGGLLRGKWTGDQKLDRTERLSRAAEPLGAGAGGRRLRPLHSLHGSAAVRRAGGLPAGGNHHRAGRRDSGSVGSSGKPAVGVGCRPQ